MKIVLGFLLAAAIGVLCRLASLPLPAPPIVIGALLVVAMSTGYAVTDHFARHRAASQRAHCGGPTGECQGRAEGAT